MNELEAIVWFLVAWHQIAPKRGSRFFPWQPKFGKMGPKCCRNNVVWLLYSANPASNVTYANYVVANTSIMITPPLWPNSNFAGKYCILLPTLSLDVTKKFKYHLSFCTVQPTCIYSLNQQITLVERHHRRCH